MVRARAVEEYPGLRSDASVADGLGFILINDLARDDGPKGRFTLTGRGVAFLRILLATPLPVQAWIDPRGDAPTQNHRPRRIYARAARPLCDGAKKSSRGYVRGKRFHADVI